MASRRLPSPRVYCSARPGSRPRTLQYFLTRFGDLSDPEGLARGRAEYGRGVLAVDEAAMIDTVRMEELLRIAARLGVARVALVGDTEQLRPVDAGQPFRLLQKAGMATAHHGRGGAPARPRSAQGGQADTGGRAGRGDRGSRATGAGGASGRARPRGGDVLARAAAGGEGRYPSPRAPPTRSAARPTRRCV